MVRTALIRRAVSYGTAAMMTCFGLTGIVSAQTITNTGQGSYNSITSTTTSNCTTTNNNNVSATSNNNQSAVSGNSTSDGNTVSGLPWTGWSALDPASAQASGQSYTSWWSGIINWVSQRASGAGWNSSNSNLSWTPSGTSWTAFDPMVWQANGQSFADWYNSLQSYLNGNSSTWMLSWPGSDTGDSSALGATTTGNATNNYNANFSININNAARAAAGTNSCGQSNFTPPATGGGMGGGGSIGGGTPSMSTGSYTPHTYGGRGSGSAYYGGTYRAPSTYHAPAAVQPSAPPASVTPPVPSVPVPSTPAPVTTPSGNTISYTGQGSHNTISSTSSSNYQVTNNNNVSATSSNNQTAVTGSSYSSGNTVGGGSGTGAASNGNASGTGVGITN